METSEKTALSEYRLEQSKQTLTEAAILIEKEQYKGANNRIYYSVFHAIRAVHAMRCFDSKKHSGVIGEFNKSYIKTGIFDKKFSDIIKEASSAREDADYEDFYIVVKEDTVAAYNGAKEFYIAVNAYFEKHWSLEN